MSGTAPVLYQQSGTERLSQEYLNRQSERAKPAALPELATPGTSYAEDRTLRQNNVLRRPVGQSADAETLTEMTKLKTLERAAKDEGMIKWIDYELYEWLTVKAEMISKGGIHHDGTKQFL